MVEETSAGSGRESVLRLLGRPCRPSPVPAAHTCAAAAQRI